MPRRTYPLELILRAHGPAELVNSSDEILWASDSDDDFREEFNDEFLTEEDIEEILEYLVDNEKITEKEFDNFANEQWDVSTETIDQSDEDEEDLTESAEKDEADDEEIEDD